MKTFFLCATVLIALPAWAQLRCLDKLLPLPRTSAPHQLSTGEWRPGTVDELNPEAALRAVNALVFAKLLCSPEEVVTTAEASCAQLETGNPDSTVCNQPTNLGHFTVTIDTQRNANVVFHKLRRQSRRD